MQQHIYYDVSDAIYLTSQPLSVPVVIVGDTASCTASSPDMSDGSSSFPLCMVIADMENQYTLVAFTHNPLVIRNIALVRSHASNAASSLLTVQSPSFLVVEDSMISNSLSQNTDSGGAILVYGGGTLFATRTMFSDNYAKKQGGAIYLTREATAYVTNCTFASNQASGSTSAEAGAVYLDGQNGVDGVYSGARMVAVGTIFIENMAQTHATISMQSGTRVELYGCQLRSGLSTDASSGNAVYNFGGTLVAVDTLFADNNAGVEGGAIYADMFQFRGWPLASPAIVDLSNCTFTGNSANQAGGAIALHRGARLTAVNSTFASNVAMNSADGGAILAEADATPLVVATGGNMTFLAFDFVSVTNCSFSQNSAQDGYGSAIALLNGANLVANGTSFTGNTGLGGALFLTLSSRALLQDCVLSGNGDARNVAAVNTAGTGAAIYAQGGRVALVGCTVSQNAGSGSGGAIYSEPPKLYNTPMYYPISMLDPIILVQDSVLDTNFADTRGGAIYGVAATVSIAGSVLSNNHAQSGGAISLSGGALAIRDSIIGPASAIGTGAQGGCVQADDFFDSTGFDAAGVVIVNTTFVDCTVVAVPLDSVPPGQFLLTGYGAGGGAGMFFASRNGAGDNSGTPVTIHDSSFIRNRAVTGAAAYIFGLAHVSINGTSFERNVAGQAGGALYFSSSYHASSTDSSAAPGPAPAPAPGPALVVPAPPTSPALVGYYYDDAGFTTARLMVSITASNFTRNRAGPFSPGGAITADGGTALAVSETIFESNAATTGAALGLRIADQGGGPLALTLRNVTASGNMALSGAFIYHDSPSPLPPAACTGCVLLNNVQSNGNAIPASVTASPAVLHAPSGQPLPLLNITIFDGDGAVVNDWLDVVVTLDVGGFTGLSGSTTALYTGGRASFALSIRDVVNGSHNLTYSVSAPSLPTIDGASGTVVALVEPCAPDEVFDAVTLVCTCSAGTFLNFTSQRCQSCPIGSFSAVQGATTCTQCAPGSFSDLNFTTCTQCNAGTFLNASSSLCQSCTPGFFSAASATACTSCSPGSYSTAGFTSCTPCAAGTFYNASSQRCDSCPPGTYNPTPGAVACVANPTGFASVSATNFSTNVSLDVQPTAFGTAQAAAMTASLATTLGVQVSAINHSVVADGGVAGRRLAQQQGLTLAVVVATQGSAAASRVRAALAAPASFGFALLTQLHTSGDPVLSAASSVSATPPAEKTVTLASEACAPVRQALAQSARYELSRLSCAPIYARPCAGNLSRRVAARVRAVRRQAGVTVVRRLVVCALQRRRGSRQRLDLHVVPRQLESVAQRAGPLRLHVWLLRRAVWRQPAGAAVPAVPARRKLRHGLGGGGGGLVATQHALRPLLQVPRGQVRI